MGDYIPPFNGDPDDPLAPFVNANPGAGIEGSIPDALMWELWQHECLNVIKAPTGPSIAPSKVNRTQLLEAIRRLIKAGFTEPGSADLLNSDLFYAEIFRIQGAPLVPLTTTWQDAKTNMLPVNEVAGATLNVTTGRFILPAGRYRAEGYLVLRSAGGAKTRLYNYTTATQIGNGFSIDSFPAGTDPVAVPSGFKSKFILTAPCTLAFQARKTETVSTNAAIGDDSNDESDIWDGYIYIEREQGGLGGMTGFYTMIDADGVVRGSGATAFKEADHPGLTMIETDALAKPGQIHRGEGKFENRPPHRSILSGRLRKLEAGLLARGAPYGEDRIDATDVGRTRLLALKADADEGEGFAASLNTLGGARLDVNAETLATVTKAVVAYRAECREIVAKAAKGIEDGAIVWQADLDAALGLDPVEA